MLPFYATMFDFYAYLFIYVCLIVFSFFRIKFLMQFFQQEEYENKSFLKFVFKDARMVDKRLTCIFIAVWLMIVFMPALCLLAFPAFVYELVREYRFVLNAKKKLVITSRVKRLWAASYIILLLLTEGFFDLGLNPISASIIMLQIIPLIMVLGNIVLYPLEEAFRRYFMALARKKMQLCKPTVIGITGSYGKTSTKHFLGHILGACSSVLYTPGNVNTLLGVSRIINTKLTPDVKFFIVEMGAYYIGSIKKVCDLVQPEYAIITSIGDAHHERFGTIENTAKAKFELAQAVREYNPDGIVVLNTKQIAPQFLKKDKKAVLLGEGQDFFITDVKQTAKALSFTLNHKKEKIKLTAPVLGIHNAEDIAMAAVLALKLGIPKSTIAAAVKTIQPVKNRLQPIKIGKWSVIDDGYNSNPTGFAGALEVLSILKKDSKGKGILVTPGMIEMGKLHDKLHAELGKQAGKSADVLLAVIPKRLKSFIQAYKKSCGKKGKVIEVASKDNAWEWIMSNAGDKDIILFENDLPDNYESSFSI